ncbi:MAG: AAA family ATPase [Saprospiraceae bacterium]
MRIHKIHIHNLHSLRVQATIDLDQPPLDSAGIFAITGDTGAGKTTLLDAVTLALYGKVARSKNLNETPKEVMSYGASTCLAEVEFSVDNERYLASWGMYRARQKADGNLIGPKRELARWVEEQQAFVPIAEKIKEVDEAVERITRLDYHRFTRSVLLSQGDFAAFLKADERDRSELLERITGTQVYSQLSIAAFERFRLEKQLLAEKEEQLRALNLLEEAPIADADLAAQRTQTQTLGEEFDRLQKQLQQRERWEEATASLQKLQMEQQQIDARIAAFSADRTRLDKSLALRPFRESFSRLDVLTQTANRLQKQTTEAAANLEQYQSVLADWQQEAANAREAYSLRQAQRQVEEALFREVEKWDDQLAQYAEQEQTAQARLHREQEVLHRIQQEQEALQRQSLEKTQLWESQTAWLANHRQYVELPSQLEWIEEKRNQLIQLHRKKEEKEQLLVEWEEKMQTLSTQIADLEHQLANAVSALAVDKQAFASHLPEPFTTNEQDAVRQVGNTILTLQDSKEWVRLLAETDKQYQQLLADMAKQEAELGELVARQQHISKELLNIADQQDIHREELAYRQSIYEQQQRIANYEKDRQELKPGDPCPLCLSTDHPFHDHPVVPYVDKARVDWEKALAYDTQLQQQQRALMLEEAGLHKDIEWLLGANLDPLKGQLHVRRQQLREYEARMASLVQPAEMPWAQDRGQAIDDHLREIETQLERWKQLQKELDTLSARILTKEQEVQQKRMRIQEHQGEWKVLQASRANEQVAKEELAVAFAKITEEVNARLLPMGHTFEEGTAKGLFKELREKAAAMQTTQEQERRVGEELIALKARIVAISEQLTVQTSLVEEHGATVATLVQQATTLRTVRQAKLGTQKVDEARQLADQQVKDLHDKVQEWEAAWQAQREKCLQWEQTITNLQQEQAEQQKERDALVSQLADAIKTLGYATVADARPYCLDQQEETRLEQEAKSLHQQWADNEQARLMVGETIAKFRPEDESLQASVLLKEAVAAHRQNYQQSLQSLGQLEEKFRQQQERSSRLVALQAEIETHRREFNRWAKLNELIGQSDGKKFRAFAQGLTLKRLVALANQHLSHLNGRYYIDKVEGEDLELEIVDTFQADNRRSMYTLSGGESFLISLSLALGLSDLAGRYAHIQSLFIDEGFGTLDAHSLDLALDTLENLQSNGKTIGIISHVSATQRTHRCAGTCTQGQRWF